MTSAPCPPRLSGLGMGYVIGQKSPWSKLGIPVLRRDGPGFVTGHSKLWSRTARGLSVRASIRDWSNDTATSGARARSPASLRDWSNDTATSSARARSPASLRDWSNGATILEKISQKARNPTLSTTLKYSGRGSMMTGIERSLGK